jgi:hypothetical protein
MATIVLPTRVDVDSFRYRITLDRAVWDVQIAWNTRDERWFLYLRDAQENLIASCPLKLNDDLFRRYSLEGAPPGLFALVDPSGGVDECGRDELGTRCQLVYVEAGDIP